MTSRRKAAVDALEEIVTVAMDRTPRIAGWPEPPRVVRNGVMPERVPPEGLVMIRTPRRRNPPAEFGEGRAVHEITIPVQIEIYLDDELQVDRDEMLSRFEVSIGEALAADTTLGGLADNAEIVEGETDDAGEEATETLAASLISVEITLYDQNPLA